MKTIIQRLKSPVVLIQLISIIEAAIVVLIPSVSDTVKVVSGAIAASISVVAGLNNPTDRSGF